MLRIDIISIFPEFFREIIDYGIVETGSVLQAL